MKPDEGEEEEIDLNIFHVFIPPTLPPPPPPPPPPSGSRWKEKEETPIKKETAIKEEEEPKRRRWRRWRRWTSIFSLTMETWKKEGNFNRHSTTCYFHLSSTLLFSFFIHFLSFHLFYYYGFHPHRCHSVQFFLCPFHSYNCELNSSRNSITNPWILLWSSRCHKMVSFSNQMLLFFFHFNHKRKKNTENRYLKFPKMGPKRTGGEMPEKRTGVSGKPLNRAHTKRCFKDWTRSLV